VIAIAILNGVFLFKLFTDQKLPFLTHEVFPPAHPPLLTLVTAMFLLAGLLHYIGNMWFQWIFARKIE
jgi:membrane associated rhomboid family serine protease